MHLVKRKGHQQKFDERKLYASIFAACLSAHTEKEQAEITSELVVRGVKEWFGKKEVISSNEIFKKAGEELSHLNKDAGFMYKTHRDVA